MPRRIVVVGAAMAGLRTAEALRSNGYREELVLVGAERHLPYNRPPLSKEVLAAEVTHEAVAFRMRASIADVTWRLGVRAVAADLSARTVRLQDGDTLGYDGLVIATGLRPRRLPVPGPPPTGLGGRHAVRTLDDAIALRERLQPGARVVVLGAGFLGCELAATARGLGCEVTCVAIDPLPIVRPLGRMLATELQRRLVERGLEFRLGVGVDAITGVDVATGVRLATGEELRADVVIEAIGSACNVEWLEGTGLDLTDGVLADNDLHAVTTAGDALDDVVAVGDLARFPNPMFDDEPRRVEHWNIPTETGRRAGAVLAGAAPPRPFAPLPAFWSDQFDLRLQSYGLPQLADEIEVLEGDLTDEVVVGYLRHGTLVGVVGIGMLQRVNSYRQTIVEGRSPAATPP